MDYKNIDLKQLTVQELEDLKYSVDNELKIKRDWKKKPKPKTKPEERKPTFNLKKGKYVELEIRDEHGTEGKPKCFYLGIIGSDKALEKLKQHMEIWPNLLDEYKLFLEKHAETVTKI